MLRDYGPAAAYERTGDPVEEQKVTVTLNQRQKIGGIWRNAGEEVEVYQQEAYGLNKRGAIDASPGSYGPYLNEEAATDLDKGAQAKSRAETNKAYAEGVREALGDKSSRRRDK